MVWIIALRNTVIGAFSVVYSRTCIVLSCSRILIVVLWMDPVILDAC